MAEISGVGVSPGRAVATVLRMPDPIAEPSAEARLAATADRAAEAARIDEAAAKVKADLEERASRAAGEAKEVLEATAMMAADPTLATAAKAKVTGDALTPERAAWLAAAEVSAMLEALGGYMAERTKDLADVRNRIVAALTGRPAPGVPARAEPYVLTAVDLAPADTATLDPQLCVALVTAEGGPTSHTAILAKALGLPAVVAAPAILQVAEGTTVLVDGAKGLVVTDPSPEQVQAAQAAAARHHAFSGEGRTADGHRVQLLANVGDAKGVAAAVEANAEGVGLFRTEFCFLDRADAPSVEEQVSAYRAVLSAFPGKKVVVRTLDAGADKPLPFLTNTDEANPALGVRGLRTGWRSPHVLEGQLEAIAQAAAAEQADVWVMAPMVATTDETETFVAQCHEHGLGTPGIMIEVPAAALSAEHLMAHAQFASLGTNDLAQYCMAADRLLGDLAALNDPWQPAVLRLIQMACEGGSAHNRPVGVCGEAASDPALATVLVGLGCASLSMTPRSIANVSAVLEAVTKADCERLAALAVGAPTAAQGRDAVRAELPVLEELGL